MKNNHLSVFIMIPSLNLCCHLRIMQIPNSPNYYEDGLLNAVLASDLRKLLCGGSSSVIPRTDFPGLVLCYRCITGKPMSTFPMMYLHGTIVWHTKCLITEWAALLCNEHFCCFYYRRHFITNLKAQIVCCITRNQ